jgi:hypothetical protein
VPNTHYIVGRNFIIIDEVLKDLQYSRQQNLALQFRHRGKSAQGGDITAVLQYPEKSATKQWGGKLE